MIAWLVAFSQWILLQSKVQRVCAGLNVFMNPIEFVMYSIPIWLTLSNRSCNKYSLLKLKKLFYTHIWTMEIETFEELSVFIQLQYKPITDLWKLNDNFIINVICNLNGRCICIMRMKWLTRKGFCLKYQFQAFKCYLNVL